ncbi:MAG: hypothetical protein HGB23_04455 [Chlorobiaceae bacterium]|nr:hypothetical protein [Chlorobiaceae bacterium]
MMPSNPANIVKTAVGVAGGTALIAPVALPVVSGLAGIAVVGVGLFAVGSLALKAAGAIKEIADPLKAKVESSFK